MITQSFVFQECGLSVFNDLLEIEIEGRVDILGGRRHLGLHSESLWCPVAVEGRCAGEPTCQPRTAPGLSRSAKRTVELILGKQELKYSLENAETEKCSNVEIQMKICQMKEKVTQGNPSAAIPD